MIGYVVYFHEVGNDSFRTEEFAAVDDAAAELYAERFRRHGPVELWRSNRLVKRWPTDISPGIESADDVSAL